MPYHGCAESWSTLYTGSQSALLFILIAHMTLKTLWALVWASGRQAIATLSARAQILD